MLVKEFEGKTPQEAIQIALETLKVEEDKIKVEMVNEAERASFFGFRSKKLVKIKVFYEEAKNNILGQEAKHYLIDLLDYMGMLASVKLLKETEDKIYISIHSKDSALLIGKQGKTLEALQFLLDVYIISKSKQANMPSKKVILDIEGYLDRRKEKVKQIALKTADEVRNTKKSILLDSMNPFERHLVHTILQDFQDIKTKSEGEGVYKKVRISCKL